MWSIATELYLTVAIGLIKPIKLPLFLLLEEILFTLYSTFL